MSEETKYEIIKAFAYGYTPAQVAEVEGLTEADAETFQAENAAAIEERKTLLQKHGWM